MYVTEIFKRTHTHFLSYTHTHLGSGALSGKILDLGLLKNIWGLFFPIYRTLIKLGSILIPIVAKLTFT